MNVHKRNREVFRDTGLVVTGLPEQYVNDHPQRMIIKLDGISMGSTPGLGDTSTFDIKFKHPEIRAKNGRAPSQEDKGYLEIDLKAHPKNRKLAELLRYMSVKEIDLFINGRQSANRFYVRSIFPCENDTLNTRTFCYFLSSMETGLELPPGMKEEGSLKDITGSEKLYYRIFRDRYPEGIRQYLDAHLDEYGYKDDVTRFIRMNWGPPVLSLPSVKEARRILDQTVYGMPDVKEQLLEFLEVIRRSRNLARNLLLVGPPGTGKTTLMKAVAKMLGLPMSEVAMSACSDTDAFVGFARTWHGSQEGLLTTAIMSPAFEYPDGRTEIVYQNAQVLFLNELDKTDGSKRSNISGCLIDIEGSIIWKEIT